MKKISVMVVLSAAVVLTGCSKMKPFTEQNFTVTPSPLEYLAGEIPATVSVNVPGKFLNKKAVVTMTPELRWTADDTQQSESQITGTSATIQGERVEANHQIISYKNGGNTTLRTTFPFREGMESCGLWMTFQASKGKKQVAMPDVKIAEGTVCTAALVMRTVKQASPALAQDNFQRSIRQKQAATIKFLIGQSNLRGSELNSSNVQDFIRTLRNIKSDEQSIVLGDVDVEAYASPDGSFGFNSQLAEKRGEVSENYVNEQLRKNKLDTQVNMNYTAEDWDGFQELVSQSNLQDKELILRVLSMYTDPEQREQEIRKVATVYSELADAVLPELRRARMTVHYEVIGRSDEQILATWQENPSDLSLEELLYAGNILVKDDATRKQLYQKAIETAPDDPRAYNNMAVLAMQQGDNDTAQNYLRQALAHQSSALEPNTNLGLLALQDGNVKDAEVFISKGSGSDHASEALGNLYIAQGKYNLAAVAMEKSSSNSAILADILAQDYAAALLALEANQNPDATTQYLKAVLGARMQNESAIREGLTAAAAADSSLARRATKDLEFVKYRSLVQQIVK